MPIQEQARRYIGMCFCSNRYWLSYQLPSQAKQLIWHKSPTNSTSRLVICSAERPSLSPRQLPPMSSPALQIGGLAVTPAVFSRNRQSKATFSQIQAHSSSSFSAAPPVSVQLWALLPGFLPPPCLMHRPVEPRAPVSHPSSSHRLPPLCVMHRPVEP